MLASERLIKIRAAYGKQVQRIVPVELDAEMLRLVLYLKDGTNLRVTEQWNGEMLMRYSYYWLTATNGLKVGWDNAPHHTQLESFSHHKHVGKQGDLQLSRETNLDEVMNFIQTEK